ncbi:polyphosphate polymerase domain-containing protein [Peptoclostridium acidaminophilum]|nr:polyphosphate polymerase domain-containing protein [Peptoclostridium acidaminophilum]
MAQYQDVFRRYEKKYMLSEQQHKALMQNLDTYMTKDSYGFHTICNVYFDTASYELIRTSIEKPVYKEKLRLRSYGIPKPGDNVFVEIKKKFDGIVYKRRVQLSLDEALSFLTLSKQTTASSQILGEIDWFMKRYMPVPKVFIAYDRLALFGNEDANLRITFDQNIRFRECLLDPSKGSWGNHLLEPGKILMEIKIPGTMPIWLSQILAGLNIFPTSFSKYGNCYKQHLIYNTYQKGGINHAG